MTTERPERFRSGDGEPLVLVHPFATTWREWKPVLDALSAERDVLAPSLPGHHEAQPLPPGVEPTIEALADGVERRLDEAGFGAPDLAGCSLGGWVALELARRGRARSVVAIGPAGGWSQAEGQETARYLRKVHSDMQRSYRIGRALCGFRAGRWALFRDFYSKPGRISPAEARYGLDAILGCSAYLGVLDALGTPDGGLVNATGLEDILCPVLILYGSKEKVTPPHQARFFLDRIPDVRSIELRGLGHVAMNDDPDLVARMILDFSRRSAERRDAVDGNAGGSNGHGATQAIPKGVTHA
jgi:pimeloyl-ACP methyl ester carboxylesterase